MSIPLASFAAVGGFLSLVFTGLFLHVAAPLLYLNLPVCEPASLLFSRFHCIKSFLHLNFIADISSVNPTMACLHHFTKLSYQIYHYQPDTKASLHKRMIRRTPWSLLEATVLLVQLIQAKVVPHSLSNRELQVHHR